MGEETYTLTSPVMGTFYRASAPGEAPLVEEGQSVTTSDIICVIESMKMFTELRSEHAGIIKKIRVENEDMVMKNQSLIEIELP